VGQADREHARGGEGDGCLQAPDGMAVDHHAGEGEADDAGRAVPEQDHAHPAGPTPAARIAGVTYVYGV